MPVFSAPAWMMKGGGSTPATISMASDADPYNMGKTTVRCTIKNAKVTLYGNGLCLKVNFDLEKNGFVDNPNNVEIWIEAVVSGHWHYIIPHYKFNFSKTGPKDKDFGKILAGNAEAQKAMKDTREVYLLFFNSTEIISDQVRVTKVVL